ncbi:helix-turn-helix domain-containing protein [Aetokthonos hydrillicola Thurmond2011]|jgi:hypothetical protein|uniref:Helix-turn-helix domain-containing protein n=1 Tax=Aetokthonos hydrillicola Thurmond2011 TaxID=2712845 RepID=A0AAP5IBY8_9CYAN|nr:helix-turn-helix domain-containing protein [Aetokthonos hydrillicola]MBO3463950.1 helix-turn-helix transcriptional regulator [Aetokthonos hydrillicola CCALA 1050]MBW4589205.1 helix-turn-helix domain-containing protein [Aetokthonos hydrillicola CCALA 1050]MDR9898765.1 helix-turn-helix domain-containing protein [Aetokthonos hydrillicola Thurmond2011]
MTAQAILNIILLLTISLFILDFIKDILKTIHYAWKNPCNRAFPSGSFRTAQTTVSQPSVNHPQKTLRSNLKSKKNGQMVIKIAGKELRDLRKEKNIQILTASHACRVNPYQLSRFERGQVSTLTDKKIRQLVKYYLSQA